MSAPASELTEFRLKQLETWMASSQERWERMFKKLNRIETGMEVNRVRIGLLGLGAGGVASIPAYVLLFLR